jgi:hypothetical protein
MSDSELERAGHFAEPGDRASDMGIAQAVHHAVYRQARTNHIDDDADPRGKRQD